MATTELWTAGHPATLTKKRHMWQQSTGAVNCRPPPLHYAVAKTSGRGDVVTVVFT